jgi:predicted polyphosphate/ATP-dependent NAD kinase
VIKRVGGENIMVVGTRDEINRLECLRVDTGDFEVDEFLSGYMQVAVGSKEEMMIEVRC